MEFAERMLKKYGWDAGKLRPAFRCSIDDRSFSDKGLGKNNQGMKAALKPVLKFDTRGVSQRLKSIASGRCFHRRGRLQSKR